MTEQPPDHLSQAARWVESYGRFFGADAWTDEERRQWIEERRADEEERKAASDALYERYRAVNDPYEEADRAQRQWVAAMRRSARERSPSLWTRLKARMVRF